MIPYIEASCKTFFYVHLDIALQMKNKFLMCASEYWNKFYFELQCIVLYISVPCRTFLEAHLDAMVVSFTKMKNEVTSKVKLLRE